MIKEIQIKQIRLLIRTYACRRLCCNNLFPLNNAKNDDDKILYKKYLRPQGQKEQLI